MSGLFQYGNVSPLYMDAGCPTQCYANNEYSDLSDYYGAVPIPASTASRIYNTPLSVNAATQQIQTPANLTQQEVATVNQLNNAAALATQTAVVANQTAANAPPEVKNAANNAAVAANVAANSAQGTAVQYIRHLRNRRGEQVPY